jgi:hypothetical protein
MKTDHHVTGLLLTLVTSLLQPFNASAQDIRGFVPGAIITLEGDTVRGLLKMKEENNVSLKDLRFKRENETKTQILSPKKINGFLVGRFTFLSKETKRGNEFWLLLLDAPVRMYEVRETFDMAEYKSSHFGMNGFGITIKHATGKMNPDPVRKDKVYRLIEKRSDGRIIVFNTKAKKISADLQRDLVKFFDDAPELSKVIGTSNYATSDIALMVYCYNEPQKYKLLPLQKH